MEARNRRSSQDWVDVLSDWRSSGKSQREYCRDIGVAESTLGYWRRKLGGKADAPALVQLGSLTTCPRSEAETFSIRSGGLRVELSERASEELLIRIFRALRAAS